LGEKRILAKNSKNILNEGRKRRLNSIMWYSFEIKVARKGGKNKRIGSRGRQKMLTREWEGKSSAGRRKG